MCFSLNVHILEYVSPAALILDYNELYTNFATYNIYYMTL